MLRLVSMSLAIAALAGCGGSDSGSGVTGTKKLTELDASERDKLCAYVISVEGSARSQMCGPITITSQTSAECTSAFAAADASCTATVDNAEGCAEATSDDLCKLLSSSDCIALAACLTTQEGASSAR